MNMEKPNQVGKEQISVPEKVEPPRPGGEVSRQLLWNSRVEQATGKEIGVNTPEGEFIRLNEGEHFAVLRDFENNSYQAVIKNDKGEIINILETGKI